MGDPYLPFRQILTVLTEMQDEKQPANSVNLTNAARLKEFVRVSGETLLDVGPDLIGIFVPGASLAVKLATRTAKNVKLMDKLTDKMAKPGKFEPRHPINPELNQENLFDQYTNVLHSLAQDRTLILFLDDLQWADSASLNLLFHLVRQLKESRLLFVGTFRGDDVAMGRAGERHTLEPILNELKRYNGEIEMIWANAPMKGGVRGRLIDSEPIG
jgi:predicted ATPase